jgi:hypothetical protein
LLCLHNRDMHSIKNSCLIASCLFILFISTLSCNNPLSINKGKGEPYIWKNVVINGGGFIDGIVFHPTEKDLRYCRTDMGGAYRWDEEVKKWIPLLDWLSYEDLNLMGVESIAIDPSDPDRVYMACGTYTNEHTPNGAILRSTDRGKTFDRIDMPIKFGANETGRGSGERLAVDPNDGSILFLGTRNDGLWTSKDYGSTWSQVKSFPDVKEEIPNEFKGEQERRFWNWAIKGSGIAVIVIDQESGSFGKASSIIYAAVSLKERDNLFWSKNGGKSWEPVSGQPIKNRPNNMILASNGILYISYGDAPGPWRMIDGSIWKLNPKTEIWKDITPDKPNPIIDRVFGYASVTVDPQHPDIVLASTFYHPEGEELYRSIDGGNKWKPVFHSGGGIFDNSIAPYTNHTGIHWLFDLEIDPFNSDHALFTTGFGGYETYNLSNVDTGEPTLWQVLSNGVEETVPLELLSPSEGAHLLTAIGDYGGFVHWDLDNSPPEGNFTNPHFGNTDGITCAELNPEIIVRVGVQSHGRTGSNIAYSLNGGKSWQPTDTMPDLSTRHGHIAVSADGKSWIWTPRGTRPFLTQDKGKTWKECTELQEDTRVVADRVNPKKFYAMDLFNRKLFVSYNDGNNFIEKTLKLPREYKPQEGYRGDSRGGQDRIYTTPNYEGDVWIAAFDGLFHMQTEDTVFTKVKGVLEIHGFGFGKAAPRSDYPALYLIGVVDSTRGIFRSDNEGKNWIRINDDAHQWGLLLHITGDPKKYGRVYIGAHGRGTLYGDPL